MPRKSIIVHGSQGCGKTRNRHVIAKHFGLTKIRDNWCYPAAFASHDTLHLTYIPPPGKHGSNVLSFDQAMAHVNDGTLTPGIAQ